MVGVHQSVRDYSARFREELRRHNYVTPKNYLDYVRPPPACPPARLPACPPACLPACPPCPPARLPRPL
jgi:hypothetical protein